MAEAECPVLAGLMGAWIGWVCRGHVEIPRRDAHPVLLYRRLPDGSDDPAVTAAQVGGALQDMPASSTMTSGGGEEEAAATPSSDLMLLLLVVVVVGHCGVSRS